MKYFTDNSPTALLSCYDPHDVSAKVSLTITQLKRVLSLVSLSRDIWTQPIVAILLGQQVCYWLKRRKSFVIKSLHDQSFVM